MADSVVSFLLENLSRLLAHEANLLVGVKDKVTSLHSELEMIDAFLKYSERKKISNEILDVVVNQLKDAAHESEDVIDTFTTRVAKQRRRNILGRIIHGPDHAKMLHEVAGKIEMLRNRINEVHSNKMTYNIEDNESTTAGEDNPRRDSIDEQRRNVEEDDVVGFSSDSSVVIQRLMEGGSHSRLTVVSIIGMGGLGKTTLARKIFNSNQVKDYFDCRAWVYVSDDCKLTEVLPTLLKCLTSTSQDVYSLSEDELKNQVRGRLIGNRYLIVLDDIWKPEDWDNIGDIFPNDGIGSRVLVTSRSKEVALYTSALYTSHTPPYYLPFLSVEESWELFCKKLFRGESCSSNLEPLGRKIVESCQGLPLTIIVLSRFLAKREKSIQEWSKIIGHVNRHLAQDKTPRDIVLKLSYDSLPRILKPCFLYFGVFPEDFEIRVRPLIQKWVAEGFSQQSGTRSPEDVAEDCLYELVDRSLIQVASRRRDGRVKTCRIHDLLRDLCICEGKKEKFFEVWMNTDAQNQRRTKPRRLSVHCSITSFLSSSNIDHSCNRSLICFSEKHKVFTRNHWKWLVKDFKLVRVLDFGQDWLFPRITSKFKALIHLRYLRLHCVGIDETRVIPDSICNLWNLETLDLGPPSWRKCVVFPSEIWKLKRLRHLHSSSPLILSDFSGFDTKIMGDLQTFSNLVLNKATASLIQKGMFPNLRKLRLVIKSKNKWQSQQLLQSIKHLTHLNRLIIFLDYDYQGYRTGCASLLPLEEKSTTPRYASFLPLEEGTFPSSITKIVLGYVKGLDSRSMETMAKLTNLLVLILYGPAYIASPDCDFDLFDLNFFPGWFRLLQVFEMKRLGVQNWELANSAMPCLQRLRIDECGYLSSLPSELWSLTTLRQVQVLHPSEQLKLMLQNLKMKNGCELVID